MKSCVRCSKEIDIISRDPDKVFYCKKCSDELLKKFELDNLELEEKGKKKNKSFIFYFIPGFYQVLNNKLLKGVFYIYICFLIPLIWGLFFYAEIKYNIIDIKIKGVNIIFTLFLVIQIILCFLQNIWEIREEK